MGADVCPSDLHDSWKESEDAWQSNTYSISERHAMGLEWVNCKVCHSTLAREVTT